MVDSSKKNKNSIFNQLIFFFIAFSINVYFYEEIFFSYKKKLGNFIKERKKNYFFGDSNQFECKRRKMKTVKLIAHKLKR